MLSMDGALVNSTKSQHCLSSRDSLPDIQISLVTGSKCTGKASHKDVKDSTSWLFRLYYGNRMFMGYCCVSCEVLYIILLLIAKNQTENLMNVVVKSLMQISPLSLLLALSIFGWSIKQIINVIQMKTAADVCVLYDIEKQHKKP
ncbi:unnamed protein product [Arabidopsis lyrata]|nr:unnamed protein product [Arabidopsis lyrata]